MDRPEIVFEENDDSSRARTTFIPVHVVDQGSVQAVKEQVEMLASSKEENMNPFVGAKQVYIQRSGFFWTRSLYFLGTRQQQETLTYISTVYTQHMTQKYAIRTFLTEDKLVVFEVRVEGEQHSCWTYLSIYHRETIQNELYSLMRGLSQLEMVSFWLVRAYAVELKLLRLEVVELVPDGLFEGRKMRFWHYHDVESIQKFTSQLICSFSKAHNLVDSRTGQDDRLNTHNQLCWYNPANDWDTVSEHYFQHDERYEVLVEPSDVGEWSKTINTFYEKYVNLFRVSLHSNKQKNPNDLVVVVKGYGAYFNFSGSIANLQTKVNNTAEFAAEDMEVQLKNQFNFGKFGHFMQDESEQMSWLKEYSSEQEVL